MISEQRAGFSLVLGRLKPLNSEEALVALINGRAFYRKDLDLIEVSLSSDVTRPDRFVLARMPEDDLIAAYLEMTNRSPGETRKAVAFCYDPATGIGELA